MIPILEKAGQLNLTETETELLAYFTEHTTSLLYMTLSDLSQKLYTSNATIVRFCQKLGLSGYNDFKYQVRRELKQENETLFSSDEYITHSIALFKDNLNTMNLQDLEQISLLLTSKRPLYICGGGLSSLPAKYLQQVMNTLDYPSILVEWGRLLPGLVNTVSSDAIIFVLSAHGSAGRFLPAFQEASKRGLTTILVTCEPGSPLTPFCSIVICTNDVNEEYQYIDINPRIGFFTVIQILIELVAQIRINGAD